MPRDAKIGLLVGMVLVLLVTLIFFRRDRQSARTNQTPAAVTVKRTVLEKPLSSILGTNETSKSQRLTPPVPNMQFHQDIVNRHDRPTP